MRLDQPGHDGATAEIDDANARSGRWRGVDSHKPAVSNGHGGGDGVGVIHRVDPAVGEHENFFWRDVLAGKNNGGRSGCKSCRRCVPEVVSGGEEAALSFRGATAGLADAGLPPPYLVVDVGGGSTELVLGGAEFGLGPGDVSAAVSLDIGSVRLTERCLRSDPPAPAEIDELVAQVDAVLRPALETMDLARVATLVGTAGTVTTVAAHALGLASYERARVHLSLVAVPDLLTACADLAAMPRERRAALGFMHPGRVDVIAAGVLVWRRVVELVAGRSGVGAAITSEHDILDGIALSLARA